MQNTLKIKQLLNCLTIRNCSLILSKSGSESLILYFINNNREKSQHQFAFVLLYLSFICWFSSRLRILTMLFSSVFYCVFIIEPTCAYARWAHVHHFVSVRDLTEFQTWYKVLSQEQCVYNSYMTCQAHPTLVKRVQCTVRPSFLNIF